MDKIIPLPLYYKVKDALKGDIKEGLLEKGDQIFPEKVIEKFGVSKITVERAIQELVNEGYVKRERGKGKGTVVISREGIENRRIVYLMMQPEGHLYHPLAESIMRNLNGDGYHTLTYGFENSNLEQRWEETLSFAGEAMVINGLSTFPFPLLDKSLQELPFLVFVLHYENKEKEYRGGYVLSDYFQGGYLAGKHLAEKGYEKLWVYTYAIKPYHVSHRHFLEGVKRGWGEEKGEEAIIFEETEGIGEKDRIEEVKEQLLARGKNCGVVCDRDYRAVILYKAIRELGWRISEDIGITGYYNTPWCEVFHPTLTSIAVREEDIGRECARLIKEKGEERVVIPPLLVERESTRRK